MTDFKMTTHLKTIIVPEIFLKLPKDIQDIVFECNLDHRSQMKKVLDELVHHIFCINCGEIIVPSILKYTNICSSICMHQLHDDAYYIPSIW